MPKAAKTSKATTPVCKASKPPQQKSKWTAEQDLALINCLYQCVSKPDWKAVSKIVGRDHVDFDRM